MPVRWIPLLVAVLMVSPAGAQGAKATPDLVVVTLSKPPGTATVGSSFKVVVKTQNVGKRRAGPSTTALFLSKNVRWDRSDLRLATRRIGPLRSRGASRAKQLARVPTGATPGVSYLLLACADAARKVREGREGNNCQRAGGRLKVRAGAATTAAPAPAPASGPTPSQDPPPSQEPTPPEEPEVVEPPSAPGGLKAITVSDEQIDLSWNPVAGADDYRVLRGESAVGPFTQVATPAAAAHSDIGLTPNETYYYVVRSANAGGESADSEAKGTTTDFTCADNGSDDVAPVPLGSIAGDAGSETKESNSAICRGGDVDLRSVTVEDTPNCAFAPCEPLSARFRLEMVPAPLGRSGDLDLCVYEAGEPEAAVCSTEGGTVSELLEVEWPDHTGTDDGRTLVAKVFGFGASATNTYTLKIFGNP